MSQIIPSRLYLPKTFEAVSRYKREDGGLRLLSSTASLEAQMEEWVRKTRNLVIGFSPLGVWASDIDGEWVETRTIALSYVPAVENNDGRPYGEAQQQSIVQNATDATDPRAGANGSGVDKGRKATVTVVAPGKVPAQQSGKDQAGNGGGRGLRVPSAVPTTLP